MFVSGLPEMVYNYKVKKMDLTKIGRDEKIGAIAGGLAVLFGATVGGFLGGFLGSMGGQIVSVVSGAVVGFFGAKVAKEMEV